MPKKKLSEISAERQANRERAEVDFEFFVNLVQPKRLLGNIHREVIQFLTKSDAKSHQLILLPRDHMKSALVGGLFAAWQITKKPDIRILYVSSTSNLAIKQLKFIKDILTCDNYRIHWPEMVNEDEQKREKWAEKEISVDHPLRKEESVRDPTVFTAGLTTNIVGMHCDLAILDDVVVQNNAYIQDMREKVREAYGYLSSIESGEAREIVVGTRYHPNDLYSDMLEMMVEEFDDAGGQAGKHELFEIFERPVESIGDGTGEFLWPRQQRSDGRWFGFDRQILADKRSKYTNQTHFRAQYYNDPHDDASSPIQRSLFQYYDGQFLVQKSGRWYFKDEPLNVFAAVDFAYSLGKKADSTAIVVVGVDGHNNYYILEIDRFKAVKPSDYYSHIFSLYERWGFRKIRAEVSVAQVVIVNDLRDNYIRKNGLSLSVEDYRPSRWQGSKEERIMAVLEPRYANRQIWHYKAGNCQILEEELIHANPAHDDVKDALASAIDFAIAPKDLFRMQSMLNQQENEIMFHSRWGGVA